MSVSTPKFYFISEQQNKQKKKLFTFFDVKSEWFDVHQQIHLVEYFDGLPCINYVFEKMFQKEVILDVRRQVFQY